jgi:Domain of unknown function (DUF4423)/Helix-turn-helix domain
MCQNGRVELAAQQFLRALRGKRSQTGFARRLGYRGNPITNWEHGRRYPSAPEALRAAQKVGVDVALAFARFVSAVPLKQEGDAFQVGAWLRELTHNTTITALARSSGLSRFALGRWLSGERMPKLPEFFALVDVITGRVPDLIAELVPITSVPVLLERYQLSQAVRRIAFEEPWAAAVQRALEAGSSGSRAIARRLDITEREVLRVLSLLEAAQLVRRAGKTYVPLPPQSVDTRGDPAALTRVKHHWAQVAAARSAEPRPDDFFAYNVISLSATDLGRVRQCLQTAFREARSIVAASEPTERIALINVQLVGWNDESHAADTPASAPKAGRAANAKRSGRA